MEHKPASSSTVNALLSPRNTSNTGSSTNSKNTTPKQPRTNAHKLSEKQNVRPKIALDVLPQPVATAEPIEPDSVSTSKVPLQRAQTQQTLTSAQNSTTTSTSNSRRKAVKYPSNRKDKAIYELDNEDDSFLSTSPPLNASTGGGNSPNSTSDGRSVSSSSDDLTLSSKPTNASSTVANSNNPVPSSPTGNDSNKISLGTSSLTRSKSDFSLNNLSNPDPTSKQTSDTTSKPTSDTTSKPTSGSTPQPNLLGNSLTFGSRNKLVKRQEQGTSSAVNKVHAEAKKDNLDVSEEELSDEEEANLDIREFALSKKAEYRSYVKMGELFTKWKLSLFIVHDEYGYEFDLTGEVFPKKIIPLKGATISDAIDVFGKKNCLAISPPSQKTIFFYLFDDQNEKSFQSAVLKYSISKPFKYDEETGILVVDNGGLIEKMNNFSEKILGIKVEEVLGKPFFSLLNQNFQNQYEYYMGRWKSFSDKLILRNREVDFIHKSGNIIAILMNGCPLVPLYTANIGGKSNIGGKLVLRICHSEKFNRDICGENSNEFSSVFHLLKFRMENLMDSHLYQIEQNYRNAKIKCLNLEQQIVKLAMELNEANELLEQSNEKRSKNTTKDKKKSNKKKSPVVDTTNLVVNERIADGTGSGATIYEVTISGWVCIMKELDYTRNYCDETQREAFLREIALLERLPYHPNICRYLYHEVKDNKLRIFLSRYKGSLSAKLQEMKEKKLSLKAKQLAKLLLDIVFGLQFLHEHKIIHRDLKCQNIFYNVDEVGAIQSLAIGDFDSAKTMDSHQRPVTCVGTTGYIAPEVLTAKQTGEYDQSVDVFSFGMIIFEMMALEAPFAYMSALQINEAIIRGEIPKVPDNLDKSFKPLVNLFHKCVKLKPKKRPTVSQIRDLLLSEMW